MEIQSNLIQCTLLYSILLSKSYPFFPSSLKDFMHDEF